MTINIQPILAGLRQPNNTLQKRSSRITVESLVADRAWRAVYVWQMTVGEMRNNGVDGQAAAFVALIDERGEPLWNRPVIATFGLSIKHGWSGMQPNDAPSNKPFEKTFPDAPGNITLTNGEYWLEIADPTCGSDRVSNITLSNPDDNIDPFNHHATLIVFQRQSKQVQPPPIDIGYVVISRSELRKLRIRLQLASELAREDLATIDGWLAQK